MKNLKIVIKLILFILIGALIFFSITPIFIPKTVSEKSGGYTSIIKGFYNESKNSLDVIFIGDSSIYKGVSPIEIWKRTKITSYNFASPNQKIWDSYYSIKEVLQYQKPSVIILNVDQVFNEYPMKDSNRRPLYDNMKFSLNKFNAIMDSIQKTGFQKKISYIFPLFRFHSRWSELEDEDFIYAYGKQTYYFKGYRMVNKTKPYKNGNYMKNNKKNSIIGENSNLYLKKIKNICKENNIELLFIEMPSPNTWSKERNQAVEKWTKDNMIKFIDLNMHLDEIGIDWNRDTQDGGEHLNINGAEKVSRYVGEYLSKNYQVKIHNTLIEQQWKNDTQIYEDYKDKLRKSK